MGFQKGSISLSPGHDVPLLLQVLHSQFITHDQLFEFMRIGCYEFQKPSFNWRVRRLVESGLLERQCAQPVTPEPIYSITNIGKLMLADHCPVMDSRRHKDAASHVNLIHSLQLNRLHLSLALQDVLADWQSEMAIRAKNEFTPAGYVKRLRCHRDCPNRRRPILLCAGVRTIAQKTEDLYAHPKLARTGRLRCDGFCTLCRNPGWRRSFSTVLPEPQPQSMWGWRRR